MKRKKNNPLLYIGFFSSSKSRVSRASSPAAVKKMSYLAKCFSEQVGKLLIVSPAWSQSTSSPYEKEKTLHLFANVDLIACPTFSVKNKIMSGIRHLILSFWLFNFLIKNVRKNEEIVVYHSLWLITPISIARIFLKIKIILEIEEVYSDAVDYGKRIRKKEIKFLKKADKFILSNDFMADFLGLNKKRCIVCYGPYEFLKKAGQKMNNGKINLVYGGTFDKNKGGYS